MNNNFQAKEYPSYEQKIAWLQLFLSNNVGPKTFFSLLEKFGSAEESLHFLKRDNKISSNITLESQSNAKKEFDLANKKNIKIITLIDKDYPSLLAQTYSPPPIIYVLGNTKIINNKSVAIVGARNASLNGKKLARKLSSDLIGHGYNVVSGMARGIDTASHEGAIFSSTKEVSTIAVLGTGVDTPYPKENTKLHSEIAEKGAIISELPLGTTPNASNFPRRNRIISGLSLGSVVVEASARSGSLITAKYAIEQNRDVFAVPGSPLDSRCEGPNKLIKQGAILTESINDIIDNLGTDFMKNSFFSQGELNFEEKIISPKKEEKNTIDSSPNNVVVENIGSNPTDIDSIIRETGLTHAQVSSILLELELEGKLERHSGNKVSLI